MSRHRPLAAQEGRMPFMPRARLGEIVVLPQVATDWQPIPDHWVLPCCRVVSTDDLQAIASRNHWTLTIYP